MASATSLSPSSSLADGRASRQPPAAAASPQCVSLPTLPPPAPVQPQSRLAKTTAYCRRMARNVTAMATGDTVLTTEEVTLEVEVETAPPPPPPAEGTPADMPEMIRTIQAAWDKVEDKYAVSTLGVAGFVALWTSAGMVSAIDRLPLIPGALELVGIGYTGWFAYRNLIFKPDREALFRKIKEIYNEVLGSS